MDSDVNLKAFLFNHEIHPLFVHVNEYEWKIMALDLVMTELFGLYKSYRQSLDQFNLGMKNCFN